MRRLIINADDFGLTSGVNRAILAAHKDGILTSATLMANSVAFEEAAHLSTQSELLSVGCHVVLVDGAPILGTHYVPTLMDQKSGYGVRFRRSAASLGGAAWMGQVKAKEIASESTAQIGKLMSAGVGVTHVDTHKHVHMFPKVLEAVILAAKACGVKAIRNPFEPVRFAQFVRGLGSRKRWIQVRGLHSMARKFRQIADAADMVTTDGCLGVVATGSLDLRTFRDLIENCPEGTWELVCHPGYLDQALRDVSTRLRESRPIELAVLTYPGTRDLLKRSGIHLISYRDLT